MAIVNVPPGIGSIVQPQTSAPARESKANKAKKAPEETGVSALATGGLGKTPMAPQSATVNQATLDNLRLLAQKAQPSEATAALGALVKEWGDAAPVAKAAANLTARMASLEAKKTGVMEALGHNEIRHLFSELKRGNPRPFDQVVVALTSAAAQQAPASLVPHTAVAPMLTKLSAFIKGEDAEPKKAESSATSMSNTITERAIESIGQGSQGNGSGEQSEDGADHKLIDEITSGVKGTASTLPGASIEMLVQLVMFECAKDSARDMREMLTTIKTTNASKQKDRASIAQIKAQIAETEAVLRKAFDARKALPEGNPLRIVDVPSFDDFKTTQAVMHDKDGKLAVSDNVTLYPQPKKIYKNDAGEDIPDSWVDEAEHLGVTPAVIARLYAYYNDNSLAVARFHTPQEWLLAPVNAGGVGLSLPKVTDSAKTADAFLAAHNAGAEQDLIDKSATPDARGKLKSWWDNLGEDGQSLYGNDIANWLSEPPPIGPGIAAGGTAETAGIDAALAARDADTSIRKLTDGPLKLSYGAAVALKKHHEIDNQGREDIEAFAKDVYGIIPGRANSDLVHMALDNWRTEADRVRDQKRIEWDGEVNEFHRITALRAPVDEKRAYINKHLPAIQAKIALCNFGIENATDDAQRAQFQADLSTWQQKDAEFKAANPWPDYPAGAENAPAPVPAFEIYYVEDPALRARQNNAAAAFAFIDTAAPKRQFALAAIDRGAPALAKIEDLRKPIDRAIKQPPKVDRPSEQTLAMLEGDLLDAQNGLDSLGDLSQEQAIKMQMVQSRYMKVMETLSNLLKSFSETSSQIIGNLK